VTKEASGLPAWFGKLPGMGDFAHRRMREPLRAAWDLWLQQGLAQLRARHADWTERYLEGPLWFFVLAEDVVDTGRWTGVLMPSVDVVGRYFPFTVLAELEPGAGVQRWWALAAQAALEGLQRDLDATQFEAALQRRFGSGDASGNDIDDSPRLPLPATGESLWLTHPQGNEGWRMVVPGLPVQAQFDALFGFEAEGAAQQVNPP
jgi:type VI secretion system protein ImpM